MNRVHDAIDNALSKEDPLEAAVELANVARYIESKAETDSTKSEGPPFPTARARYAYYGKLTP